MSAFVSSAAVGVYITDCHYKDKHYTHKKTHAVVTSFCVMSIGYLGVLTEIAGIAAHYTAVVIWIIEVSLPAISISGLGVATQSAFVVALSAVQIIFFTEAANAMLAASFKTTAPKLIIIFFLRTIIAVPLVALLSHLIF